MDNQKPAHTTLRTLSVTTVESLSGPPRRPGPLAKPGLPNRLHVKGGHGGVACCLGSSIIKGASGPQAWLAAVVRVPVLTRCRRRSSKFRVWRVTLAVASVVGPRPGLVLVSTFKLILVYCRPGRQSGLACGHWHGQWHPGSDTTWRTGTLGLRKVSAARPDAQAHCQQEL